MIIEVLKKKRLELAISIIREILLEEGGKAQWPKIHEKWIPYSSRFPDVELSDVLNEALKRFPTDERTGYYFLPQTLAEFKSSKEIVEEIKELMRKFEKEATSLEKSLIAMVEFGRAIKEKMKLPDDYLALWKNTSQDVLMELRSVITELKQFFNKYGDNAPSAFEYIVAKALCVLFQLPLYIDYGALITLPKESCVLWRGMIEDYKPIKHAPGGGSDIVVYARGPYYVLTEATLKYTPKQWKEEIEPSFRHVEDFIKRNKLSSDDVYLVFITAGEVLNDTYRWLYSKAETEEYKILALRAEDLIKIVKASLFALGLTHAEIRGFFNNLHRSLVRNYEVKEYVRDLEEVKNRWCRDLLEPSLEVFISAKAYEILLKQGGFLSIDEIANKVTECKEVKDYMDLVGRTPEYVTRRKRYWIHQLSLLGLAREVNGNLKALPIDEFENKILKTYSYILKVAKL